MLNCSLRKVKTKITKNAKMETATPGEILPPKLSTTEDYRDFLRAGAGSKIKPGSEAERAILDAHRASRASRAQRAEKARGTRDQPGPIAQELAATESSGFIKPADAQAARERGEIAISKIVGGVSAEASDTPVEGKPVHQIPIEQPVSEPGNVPVHIARA
jgi:hypothetical protein